MLCILTTQQVRLYLPREQALYGRTVTIQLTAASSGVTDVNMLNNARSSSPFTFPVLWPDLQPTIIEPTPGTTLRGGEQVVLVYEVVNTAGVAVAGTSRWNDEILLQDRYNQTISTFAYVNGEPIGLGDSYRRSVNITLPRFCFGAVQLAVAVDPNQVVDQHGSAAVVRVAVECMPAPTADLMAVTATATIVEQGLLEFVWTVFNGGQTVDGLHAWQDVCSLTTENSTSPAPGNKHRLGLCVTPLLSIETCKHIVLLLVCR